MSREGRETEEVGLVRWVVTKVSIGSNYFLIYISIAFAVEPIWGGVSNARWIGARSNTDISEV